MVLLVAGVGLPQGRVVALPRRHAPGRGAAPGSPTHAGPPPVVVPADEDAERTADAGVEFDVRTAYADHGRSLLGFAVNSLGDRQLAEECVQETFVRAWKARDRFGAERGSVRTWLFAIARNVVIDAHRARARRPAVPTDLLGAGAGNGPVAASTDPRDDMAASLDRLVVHEALARITPEHRDVIVAVHLRGAGYTEVSEATGVPVATLRTRMYYGLRALRSVLGEMGEQHV